MLDAIIEGLDLEDFKKLYRERGRSAYHPKMMLKIILYAYMNNVYSCRKIEQCVQRDINFIWPASQERPDYVTINRFRNRVKSEINNIFTKVVLLLAERGFITPDVEYIDGTKIESKANKYTFVWRRTAKSPRAADNERRVLPSRTTMYRAGSRLRTNEIQHGIPAFPSLRQRQGHNGLCLLCHCL